MSEPWGMLDEAELPARYGSDTVHAMARDPGTLFIYWELTEAGRGDAAARLPAAARALGAPRPGLRLRAASTPALGAATSHELLLLIDDELGQAYVDWPHPGWACVELGVIAGGVFAAVCAAPPAPVPPAMPAASGAARSATSPWRRREGQL